MSDKPILTNCSRIAVVVPYFGRLPDMFPLWLLSCQHNSNIDWLLITDDHTCHTYPSNVRVIYTSFEAICEDIQKCFQFKIKLTSPWGLCAFRPAYGHIFQEHLKGYDFWGYCDLDVIFGKISRFISEGILREFDKIMWLGHFALYRNNSKVNFAYKLNSSSGEPLYIQAFSTTNVPCFDEVGINDILEANGCNIYRKTIFADFAHRDYLFNLLYWTENSAIKRQIFCWKDGVLSRYYLLGKRVLMEEFMYIHFCRRPMKIELDNLSQITQFCMIPNKFCGCPDVIDVAYVLKNTRNRIYWEYWLPRIKFFHVMKKVIASLSRNH